MRLPRPFSPLLLHALILLLTVFRFVIPHFACILSTFLLVGFEIFFLRSALAFSYSLSSFQLQDWMFLSLFAHGFVRVVSIVTVIPSAHLFGRYIVLCVSLLIRLVLRSTLRSLRLHHFILFNN